MNHYKTNDDTLICFSGGRTSGYMLKKTIDAHGGSLPDFVKICFANTGKEMPETLNFVRDCEEFWNVKIHWLEYDGRTPKTDNPSRYDYKYKVVNYETASRKGEPFEKLINDVGIPNAVGRFCSGQLKIRTINRFLVDQGFETPHLCMLGLRADEERRAVKLLGKVNEGSEKILPLYRDKVTKETVAEFWRNNEFDLNLANNNGTTDFGNCDLCFLKGQSKLQSIIKHRPDLATWWIEQEEKQNQKFKENGLSYKELKIIATSNENLFPTVDDTLPCFCGD